jgi:alcohol dehydrogenase
MKALVYHGPGQKSWDDVPDPTVTDPTDIVVRVDTSTICGTDLHILKGDVPTVEQGRLLGHEAVGTVVATGAAVTSLAEGDRVIIPAITSCGRCANCKRAMPSHCLAVGGVGWIFGHLIDGLQAEYARVPFAETSVHKVPEGVTDTQVLFLTDILPTGYEVGVRNGRVKPGDTVAVVGAGPVGLAAIMTCGLHGASRVIAIDTAASRQGADVAIEAVGVPETFETCARIVRPGGVVANIGVHGASATLHLEELWIKNITITTGLVDTVTVPMLLQLVRDGRIRAEMFGTHDFALDKIMDAYDVFANAAEHNALKVVLKR